MFKIGNSACFGVKVEPKMVWNADIIVGKDAAGVSKHLAETLDKAWVLYTQSNTDRPFIMGLSGGSLPKFLVGALDHLQKLDWTKVKFIFCDERLVAFDDGDSTFKVYKDTFLPALKAKGIEVGEDAFVLINPELNGDAAASAKDYAEKLAKLESDPTVLPRYDVLLLGMGPDGHTCSLFPSHKLLEEKTLKVAPITDSPKPPSSRITLTYPVINNAKNCVFVCTGEGKKNIVKKILQDKEDYPATRVNPQTHVNDRLVWILDAPAAQNLSIQTLNPEACVIMD